MLTGDLNAIQAAMIVGAVPFSFIMILMGIVLLKALDRYGLREQRLAQKEAPCNSQHKS
ncbi:BCCT family transporter [Oceanospirillaceae bacterium]|nr:BCCT family transporter [Oceanospirillaceae bacterium]